MWRPFIRNTRDNKFTSLVNQINSYNNSQREAGPAPLPPSNIEQTWSDRWQTDVERYHHALDVLRENWALETYGCMYLGQMSGCRGSSSPTYGVPCATKVKKVLLNEPGTKLIRVFDGHSPAHGVIGPRAWAHSVEGIFGSRKKSTRSIMAC